MEECVGETKQQSVKRATWP